MAAEVGVEETTLQPECFALPTNPKIKFWDLPGIGTPNYPDIKTYCEKVPYLGRCHAFLIFSTRFTEHNSQLAQKIKSMNKSFFFIRSKIDASLNNEGRKDSFKEDATLENIRSRCLKSLHGLVSKEDDIFLISNRYPARWDFPRLSKAILDALPMYQRESLTLSLSILTSLSTDTLKRKVEILQGRMSKVALRSAAVAVVPVPGLSILADLVLLHNEISFYKSQLGIPKEGTEKFAGLSEDTQKEVMAIWKTMATASQIGGLMAAYYTEQTVEEFTRVIPFVGWLAAGVMSFASTYLFLKRCLKEIEKVALMVLSEASDNFSIK